MNSHTPFSARALSLKTKKRLIAGFSGGNIKNLLLCLGLLFCGLVSAEELPPPVQAEHAPFKERLWTGPGYTPGVDNVLKGWYEAGNDAPFLVSPNWRCGIDPYSWFMQNASHWEDLAFRGLSRENQSIFDR